MKKFLKIILLLISIIPLGALRTQVMDLSALEGLTTGNTSNYSNIDDQEGAQKKNEQVEKTPRLNPISLEALGYGFQGKNNFNLAPQIKYNSDGLNYFGYDFFFNSPSTFSQLQNIPIPLDYILGPGDVVKIILFGTDNRQLSLRISRNGEIVFPEIGPISLVGMTFQEMKETIEQRISTQFIGTKASITLGSLRSMNIFVLGEASQPGMYTINSLSTLTNAIFASGGVKTTGTLRNIELKRDGKVIQSFDFYDLLLNGDTSSDIQLMPNDVVFIPPINKTVGIIGEVIRNSNVYELKDGEDISHLIQYAGGTTAKADLSSVEIQRVDFMNKGFELLSIDLNQANASQDSSNIGDLNSGDVIYIYPVYDSMNKAILLSGHVKSPGFYPWKQGATLGDIIKSKKDLLPSTDLNYVLIKNNNSNGKLILRQIDLEDSINNLDQIEDIILDEKDEIFLFPKLLSLKSISSKLIDFDLLSEDQKNYFLKQTETIKTYDENGLIKQERISPVPDSEDKIEISQVKNDRFYEYRVNQYCLLPNTLAKKIVESGWISSYLDSNKTKEEEKIRQLNNIEATNTENIFSQDNINSLNLELITEAQINEGSKSISSEEQLTDICRRQLLQEILNIVRSQSSTLNPRQSVSIFGNIFFPGEYPLTERMKISDLVKASGGLKDDSLISQLELITSKFVGKEYQRESQVLSVSDSLFSSYQLRPGDILNIKRTPKVDKSTTIAGEVYFPGAYPISKNETLKDLLLRAGGVNDQGNLKGAYFQRESLKRIEYNRLKKAQAELNRTLIIASQTSSVGEEKADSDYIETLQSIIKTDINTDSLGRVVINLSAILSGEEEDILLEDGDTLTIPQLQPIISVIGEVFSPNSHMFDNNMTVVDFIEKSGGITDFANKNDIYIIKADGSIIPPDMLLNNGFFRRSSSILEAGDAIVVPISVSTYSNLRATTEITQIIYQMALAAAAVNSF